MIRSTILMLAAALPLTATAGYAVAAPSASEPSLGATDPAITGQGLAGVRGSLGTQFDDFAFSQIP